MKLNLTHPEIEEWLASEALNFRLLSTKEYVDLTHTWRQTFDPLFMKSLAKFGLRAELAVAARLPCSVFVFSIPGYMRPCGSLTRHSHPTTNPFGYYAEGLKSLSFVELGTLKIIITNDVFSLTAMVEDGYFEVDTTYVEAPS